MDDLAPAQSPDSASERRRFLVFFNPRSGLEDVQPKFLDEALQETGADFDVCQLRGHVDFAREIEKRDPDEAAVVVAAGGDGTVAGVANALRDGPRSFGVLPLGTRNHFARDAGIPTDLAEAIANLMDAVPRPIDTGDVNGQGFINNASLGLYPRFVEERRRQLKRSNRWLAIAGSAWWVLRRRRHLEVRLSDEASPRRASIVFVGNNRYRLEGLEAGQRERLDEGLLTVSIANLRGPVSATRLVSRAALGRLELDRDYSQRTVRELDVEVKRKHVRVALDGETVRMQTPLHFRVRPGSLRVLTPRSPEPDATNDPEADREWVGSRTPRAQKGSLG